MAWSTRSSISIPFFPRIKAAERLRESRGLLDRVIPDLEACIRKTDTATPAPSIADAKKLAAIFFPILTSSPINLQNAAQQLWKNR